jgi:hypothetical protein
MGHLTVARVSRIAITTTLLPVLVGILWIEVAFGAAALWNGFSGSDLPGRIHWASGLIGVAMLALGPAVVVVVALLTRHDELSMSHRLLRIECMGIVATLIPVLFILVAIVGSTF